MQKIYIILQGIMKIFDLTTKILSVIINKMPVNIIKENNIITSSDIPWKITNAT